AGVPKRCRTHAVSTGGGVQPRWSFDGKEIYFISPDGRMMAAAVRYAQNGSSVDVETPVTLFPTRIAKFGTSFKPQYAVSRDGRFLIDQPLRESITPITLILNWKSAAKK